MNFIRFSATDYFYMKGTPFERHALHLDDFELPIGGIYGVVGETGSGKSTFCRLLAGLLPGCEHLCQLPFSGGRENVGYVFQQPEHQLFENTVREELEFSLKNFDYPRNKWGNLCEQALLMCGLESAYLDKNPMILSGGEKRRVAIASILVYEPRLLILDEPTAGVDGAGRQILIKTIINYARNGGTVVWVSHELDDILLYTENCLFFEHGRLAAFGTVYEVLRDHGSIKTDILRYVEESGCGKHKIKALLRAIARKYEK